MKFNWYIVKNGEIVSKCGTDEEVAEIIGQDTSGELEAYPIDAMIGISKAEEDD